MSFPFCLSTQCEDEVDDEFGNSEFDSPCDEEYDICEVGANSRSRNIYSLVHHAFAHV